MKCIGEKCKYCKNDLLDTPPYCGLISVISNILKIVNLPRLDFVFWYSNVFVECPFNDFEICIENNLEYSSVYLLNERIKENLYISPNDYIDNIDYFKKGGSKNERSD